mgnify:CR=1 FL=1
MRCWRCDSEWPYEVTETRRAGSPPRQCHTVAIVNGRMRSLKLAYCSRTAARLVGCDSEWPYEVTETARLQAHLRRRAVLR